MRFMVIRKADRDSRSRRHAERAAPRRHDEIQRTDGEGRRHAGRRRAASQCERRAREILEPQADRRRRSVHRDPGPDRRLHERRGRAMTAAGAKAGMTALRLPTYDDVAAAAAPHRRPRPPHAGPAPRAPPTPSSAPALFFKCENFQRMGAFKFRGAYNALSRFDERQRRAGVVAFSSGNHAQAIALAAHAARHAGDRSSCRTTRRPRRSPRPRATAPRSSSTTATREDREAIGRALAEERGMTLIPPYDHPDVIAGQGTAAKELIEEVGAARRALRLPRRRRPARRLGARGRARSRRRARCSASSPRPATTASSRSAAARSSTSTTPRTIADGAQTQHLGEHTFPIIRRDVRRHRHRHRRRAGRGDALLRRAHEDGRRADRLPRLRRGAARCAPSWPGKRVGVLVSGGNVDLARFAELVGAAPG